MPGTHLAGDTVRWALLLLAATMPAPFCTARTPESGPPQKLGADQAHAAVDEVWLAVTVNGQPANPVTLVLQGQDGRIYVTGRDLVDWRLPVPSTAPIQRASVRYYSLDSLAGLTYHVDGAQQILIIDAPASLLSTVRLEGRTVRFPDPTPSPFGAYLNYDAVVAHTDQDTSANALLEGNVFGPFGTATVRFLERPAQPGLPGHVRLESTWVRDDPADARTFRLGDSITGSSSSWGGAVRFGGLQWASNFLTRPGLLTIALPGVTGEAALPSTVDVYVNGVHQIQQSVPP